MPKIANELFLLSTNLSQLKSKELIIKLFIESINSIFQYNGFVWNAASKNKTNDEIVVCTRFNTYGYIGLSKKLILNDEEVGLLQNATQLLAIILEKLEQDALLNDQKNHLNYLVEEKTRHLLQNQMELKEKAEEIEAQNEEYVKLNEELLRTNQELIKEKEKAEIGEKKIKEQSEEIENFFSCTIDLLCIANTEGYFLRLNKEWENTLGFTLDELKGKHFLDYVHQDDLISTNKAMTQLENQISVINFTNRFRCKDGSYKWIEWKSYPFGQKIFATARDITERKRIEIELITAKNKAEESDRLKTAFLQNMSHEIRTPMNSIMGFSELLIDQYNNRPKLEYFSKIINQRCNDLLDIINDILDIAKIESGQLPINYEEFNLESLFEDLTSFFKEYSNRISKNHLTFHLNLPKDPFARIIVTDKVKLKQIFINLLINAFKFTNEGSIEGGCKIDANQNLLFYVTDTGIGIPLDKQQFVFERFAQLNPGINQLVSGTGLGLSIVKGLINLLEGNISLKSEPGNGSTFTFSIPYKSKQTSHVSLKEIKNITEFNYSNKSILIVEDDLYNSAYLKEILTDLGLKILQAENGKKAVELSLTQPIDLILMDIRLPDIDGYEATRQIRLKKPSLKIIAQTAYASQDEKDKALNAGCNDYFSKPIKKNTLLSMIGKHLTNLDHTTN